MRQSPRNARLIRKNETINIAILRNFMDSKLKRSNHGAYHVTRKRHDSTRFNN
jgi:hypothetical protein